MAVTATPWPMGTVPIDEPYHLFDGSSSPADSPGNLRSVCAPNPKARRYLSRRSFPSLCATMIVPMFEELVTMSVTEYCCTGWVSLSWNTASDTLMLLPTVNETLGLTTFSSSAPAMVTSLLTEPGQHT